MLSAGPSILVIDNDTATFSELEPALDQEGFRVAHVAPGLAAMRRLMADPPDLVILGLEPQESAWQFSRLLLTFLDTPLLLLLSGGGRLDRVRGLDLGADDCIAKPFLTAELVARVRALLRRSTDPNSRSRASYFVDKDLVIDLTRKEIRLDDEPVLLTPTEFRLMWCFAMHVGEVLSRERLIMHLWGAENDGARDSVRIYIHQLRQKLEADPSKPQRIITRRGQGYMFRRLADD